MLRTITMLVALWTTGAHALDLKGLKPGMTLAEVRAIVPSLDQLCEGQKPLPNGSTLCPYFPLGGQIGKLRGSNVPALNTFANHEIKNMGIFHDGERLVLVMVTLDGAAFDDLHEALAAKFGKPFASDKSTVQNRMGASFDQVQTLWTAGDTFLRIKKRASKLDEMLLTLGSQSGTEERAEKKKEHARSNAKDL